MVKGGIDKQLEQRANNTQGGTIRLETVGHGGSFFEESKVRRPTYQKTHHYFFERY